METFNLLAIAVRGGCKLTTSEGLCFAASDRSTATPSPPSRLVSPIISLTLSSYVMMESIGFGISIVALASLFSTCVECFDYFRLGQAFDRDFEILLVQLDLEKFRLLNWGNSVGIFELSTTVAK